MQSARSDNRCTPCCVLIRQFKSTHVDAIKEVAADDIQRHATNRRSSARFNARNSNSGDGVKLVSIVIRELRAKLRLRHGIDLMKSVVGATQRVNMRRRAVGLENDTYQA